MSRWTSIHYTILLVILLGLSILLCLILALMWISQVLVGYLVWLGFLVSVNIVLSAVFSKGVHIHHWFIGLMIMSLCGSPNLVLVAFNGFAAGMWMEGTTRWSMAPVY